MAKEIDPATHVSAHETVALPLSRLPLDASDRRKIDQYLDVTRSELLFTQRATLVEGIEAVLIPALARHCIYPGDSSAAKASRRRFRGTSIISVGSVDFSPYVRLLLTKIDGIRLADSVVIITDGDPALEDAAEEHTPPSETALDGDDVQPDGAHPPAPYNRASSLQQLGAELDAGDALYVAEAPHTLEADLLVPGSTNSQVLRAAYLSQHPRSAAKWDAIARDGDPAGALYKALREKQPFVAKGQFAHDVAQQISDNVAFICPDYLDRAIRRIVGDAADG